MVTVKRGLAAVVGLVGITILLAMVYLWDGQQDPAMKSGSNVAAPAPAPASPIAEPSSLEVTRSDLEVRLEGTVKTESEREAVVAAVTNSGFGVDDALVVSESVTDSDARLVALLLPPLLNGTNDGELSLEDGVVLVSGEALDPVEAEAITDAIDAAVAAGLTVENETTVRVLPEDVQIVALQDEINQIFELARTIEGQSPNFAVSLEDLSPGAEDTLDRVAVAMRRYPLPHADIIGHTDAIGSEADNLALSEARAQVVLDFLVSRQIDPARLEATGRGESEPIADNDDEAGRAENRRVDFVVTSSQG